MKLPSVPKSYTGKVAVDPMAMMSIVDTENYEMSREIEVVEENRECQFCHQKVQENVCDYRQQGKGI